VKKIKKGCGCRRCYLGKSGSTFVCLGVIGSVEGNTRLVNGQCGFL